ncbi:NAD binding Rossmann fold oxidoreductase [Kockiozyma suomiensis]|uniref:NAD binding Rossmann fold oxidoreductase n=1 Tax=Kockiozyma suomiensis TaxID=1337062 RepID=UPI0033441B8B
MTAPSILRVGLIGCGEVAQVVHIPTLNFLSDYYQITYLCDVSQNALEHCQKKVTGGTAPEITKDASVLCKSDNVDVVFVVNSDEYHCAHALIALENDKSVLIEKPMALNDRDADLISAAAKKSKGKVMVGYMRRYAPIFEDAVKEIGGLDKINYARVRDIIGPNDIFVNQSGTFPKRFSDFTEADGEDRAARGADIVKQALEVEAGVSDPHPLTQRTWRLLCGLGSHDLSLMREALGMPVGVLGARILNGNGPFVTALFDYGSFVCTYETGINSLPLFDACIEIVGQSKSVTVQYDTPYVKGLPIIMTIKENVNGEYHESKIRKTYEDPYTVEAKKLYKLVTEGTPVKTTPEDAEKDLELFRMIIRAAVGSTDSK